MTRAQPPTVFSSLLPTPTSGLSPGLLRSAPPAHRLVPATASRLMVTARPRWPPRTCVRRCALHSCRRSFGNEIRIRCRQSHLAAPSQRVSRRPGDAREARPPRPACPPPIVPALCSAVAWTQRHVRAWAFALPSLCLGSLRDSLPPGLCSNRPSPSGSPASRPPTLPPNASMPSLPLILPCFPRITRRPLPPTPGGRPRSLSRGRRHLVRELRAGTGRRAPVRRLPLTWVGAVLPVWLYFPSGKVITR